MAAALTPLQVKNAKVAPGKSESRLWDSGSGGLYLTVTKDGAKWWRVKYRFAGKERRAGLGSYPKVSLHEARVACEKLREQVRRGFDPAEAGRAQKAAQAVTEPHTFGTVAAVWLDSQRVSTATDVKNRWMLETHLLPALRDRPIAELTTGELLTVLKRIEKTGMLETAKRARIKLGQIFDYAIGEQIVENDPTTRLRGKLKPPRARHHAAVTDPPAIGQLMRAIDGFTGQPTTKLALQFSAMTFVRPGELRQAEWKEMDTADAVWRIPAAKMKMKAAHLVPLSSQAIKLLHELRKFTGHGKYLFPSMRGGLRPMSENTINAALRRLGYTNDEMTAHGFRSMAATRLNEMGWRADAIERQLAHAESNDVRAAYTGAAQYLDERRKMMQAWADYLQKLAK